MTSGNSPTSTIAPRRVQRRRGRGRAVDFSSGTGTSDIFEIIKDDLDVPRYLRSPALLPNSLQLLRIRDQHGWVAAGGVHAGVASGVRRPWSRSRDRIDL